MLMKGKKGIIFGVANQRSIAWAIAQSMISQGAEVAFAYLNERLRPTVEKLTKDIPNVKLYECDVTKPETITSTFEGLKNDFGSIDFLVHSIAFADKEDLGGSFRETSREGFSMACDISAYSLISLANAAEPIMNDGGSILALTYLGSVKACYNYNVMGVAKAALEANVRYLAVDLGERGIRVNALSAGPIKTLAARGIPGFSNFLKIHEKTAPLKRCTTVEEVGDVGLFLCSDLSRGMTAEVLYVDGGFSQVGVGPLESYNLD